MGQPNESWEAAGGPPQPSRRGLFAATAAAALVLAVVGGTAGWLIADRTAFPRAAGSSTPTPSNPPSELPASEPPASEPPVAEPSQLPTSGAPSNTFPLPDVRGTDFEQARRQLRDLGLGVQVYFALSGDSRSVLRTDPVAGKLVRRGITVKIYVAGEAPYATIPNVLGVRCNEAGSVVAEHGLVPRYPNGRNGVVLRQDPPAEFDGLRWNETVRLYCGSASPAPSPAPDGSASPQP